MQFEKNFFTFQLFFLNHRLQRVHFTIRNIKDCTFKSRICSDHLDFRSLTILPVMKKVPGKLIPGIQSRL